MNTPDMADRIIMLAGVHNFRDYGGYLATNGARLRNGSLYRSAQHQEATADDLARIGAINLATVIDLRGASEREKYPCARPDGFEGAVLFADGETTTQLAAPHIEAARNVRTADDAMKAMIASYCDMPFRPVLVGSMRLYFDSLATRDGPSLVHCLAGKDRTGVAVALLHHLLGVNDDDVMADYLLTNVAGNVERRIAAGARLVRKNHGPDISDEAVRTLMTAHPAWLDAMFAAIRDRHGSIRDYADVVLGVSPELLAALEDRLLI